MLTRKIQRNKTQSRKTKSSAFSPFLFPLNTPSKLFHSDNAHSTAGGTFSCSHLQHCHYNHFPQLHSTFHVTLNRCFIYYLVAHLLWLLFVVVTQKYITVDILHSRYSPPHLNTKFLRVQLLGETMGFKSVLALQKVRFL